MTRFAMTLGLAAVFLATAAPAADLGRPVRAGAFRATCEDPGTLCYADACGRNQIEAALTCQALCPSSSVMSVVPERCPLNAAPDGPVLRRRG